jgi:multimeric flavodoxin WrbA
MKHVYPKLEQADILVFGTPLYWYGPTAKMKMLIDRLRPFVENKKLKGKRAVIVVPSAEGAHACELVNEMFRLSLDYIGVELLGNLFVTAYEKAEIANNKQELARAYALGASFQV